MFIIFKFQPSKKQRDDNYVNSNAKLCTSDHHAVVVMQVYVAQMFYAICTTCQLLHLIFIAKGWNIGSSWIALTVTRLQQLQHRVFRCAWICARFLGVWVVTNAHRGMRFLSVLCLDASPGMTA